MNKRRGLLAIAAAVSVVLAGCTQGADTGPEPAPPPSGTALATPATPTATPVLATITCDVAPISLVSSILEQPVEDQSTATRDGRLWCSYRFGGAGSVSVVMSRGVNPDQFDQLRNLIEGASNMDFTELPGFEDRAFAAKNPHAPIPVNAVAGLRGTTAVLVTGTHASLDAEKQLVSTLLDKLVGAR